MFDFSSAQIHLAVNHLTVFGALLASVLLVLGMAVQRSHIRDVGLALMIFAAVAALPAYFSGEGAEEIVEDRPGVSEALIEGHEEAAEQALAIVLIAGFVAAAALLAVRLRRDREARVLLAIALVSSLAATGSMARVAHLGGQIRHDELRPQVASAVPGRIGGGHQAEEGEEDD